MPKQRDDDSVPTGDDVADVVDGTPVESGVGGPDQPADERTTDVMIYTDLREFLIASAGDPRPKWNAYQPDGPQYWGIANTECQFRKALCDFAFPIAVKLSRDELQRLMADELKTMGAAE